MCTKVNGLNHLYEIALHFTMPLLVFHSNLVVVDIEEGALCTVLENYENSLLLLGVNSLAKKDDIGVA